MLRVEYPFLYPIRLSLPLQNLMFLRFSCFLICCGCLKVLCFCCHFTIHFSFHLLVSLLAFLLLMLNDRTSRKCPGDSFLDGAESFYSFFLFPKDQKIKSYFFLSTTLFSSCETFCVFLCQRFTVEGGELNCQLGLSSSHEGRNHRKIPFARSLLPYLFIFFWFVLYETIVKEMSVVGSNAIFISRK